MLIYVPVFVWIIGLILFFAARTNGDVKEAGRIMFFAGLLVTLLQFASHIIAPLGGR